MSQRVLAKDLRGIAVETRSGDRLGRLVDIELDQETLEVATIIVRPSRLAETLVRSALRIARSQVVSIAADRIIVDDAVRGQRADGRRVSVPLAKGASPALSSRGD